MLGDVIPDPSMATAWQDWASKLREFLLFQRNNPKVVNEVEGVEYLVESVTFQGRPVYKKHITTFFGPNGTPSATAALGTVHGVTGMVLDGYIRIEGSASFFTATARSVPVTNVAGSNVDFFYLNATKLVLQTNYNATTTKFHMTIYYQKA